MAPASLAGGRHVDGVASSSDLRRARLSRHRVTRHQVLVERVIDASPHRIALAIAATCQHDLGRTKVKRFSRARGDWEIEHKIGPRRHTYRLFPTGPYTLVQMLAKGRFPVNEENLRTTMKVQLARIARDASNERVLA
jgi:hypothetical protein